MSKVTTRAARQPAEPNAEGCVKRGPAERPVREQRIDILAVVLREHHFLADHLNLIGNAAVGDPAACGHLGQWAIGVVERFRQHQGAMSRAGGAGA
jgi:hypothetical protein